MVSKQLTQFLNDNNLLPKFQSGFRAQHSTETAVLKVMADIMAAADQGDVTLLGLLDMSAAFDTVDHQILLERLHVSFGFSGSVITWLSSFLDQRTQQIIFNDMTSDIVTIASGVPQGSVLGPLLFLLYTADVPVIASSHNLGIHCYADDGQLYVYNKASGADSLVSRVTACIADIDLWMFSNRLKLNSDKTQFIWLGTWQQLQKITIDSITLSGSIVEFQSSVNNLGVKIDSNMTMKDHVLRICHSSFYQLRQLRTIRKLLSMEASMALVHAFVASRLDYCNSLLYGISNELLHRLQSVLRSAARLVMRKRKFDPISDDMRDILHWLPISQRIQYKVALLVFKCLRGQAPPYLSESLSLIADNPSLRHLRSAVHGNLVVPRTRTARLGKRNFFVAGPMLWNSLPSELKQNNITMDLFKSKLKTFLFEKAYPKLTLN